VFATWLAVCWTPWSLAADRYVIDTVHSAPEFEFKHLGVTTQSGRFDRASGNVTLDLAARKGSVTYEVDTRTLNMGYGAESPESPAYRLFDVAHFPTITFTSSRLIFDDNRKVVAAQGQLRLLGVSRPLTVTVKNFRCALSQMTARPMCAGDATAVVKRSEFGMVRFIPFVSDEIVVNIPVEAYKD
jgi:polyisoprenoid-binding protein YceI